MAIDGINNYIVVAQLDTTTKNSAGKTEKSGTAVGDTGAAKTPGNINPPPTAATIPVVLPPKVLEIIALAQLERVFSIFPTVDDAIS